MEQLLWPTILLLLACRAVEGRVLLQQATFYYSDYVYGRVQRPATFLPNPQYCPQTGGTVCSESVPYYPRKTILQAAKQFNRTDLFVDERQGDSEPDMSQIVRDQPSNGYVVYQTMHYPNYFHSRSLTKRNIKQTESACATRTTFLSPRTALNDKAQWKFIVNIQNTQYQQVIRIELCAEESSTCTSQIQVGPGFKSVCKQKYLKKKLLALNPDGKGLSTENFFVPSCCVCNVARDDDK